MVTFDNVGARLTVVKVLGDVDISCRDVFRKELDGAAAAQSGPLAVSLEDCSYCDCSAIGVLIGVRNKIGARLRIVIPQESRLRVMFARLGLLDVLGVAATVADVVASTASVGASPIDFACPKGA